MKSNPILDQTLQYALLMKGSFSVSKMPLLPGLKPTAWLIGSEQYIIMVHVRTAYNIVFRVWRIV